MNFDTQEEVGKSPIKLWDLHKLRKVLEIYPKVPWKGTQSPKAPTMTYRRGCKHEYPLFTFSAQ